MQRPAIVSALGILTVYSGAPRAAITEPVKITGGLVSSVPGRDRSITVFKGLP